MLCVPFWTLCLTSRGYPHEVEEELDWKEGRGRKLFCSLSGYILSITCLVLFFCNQFIALYSLHCQGMSAGEEQPNLAAPTCPRWTRFMQ